MVTERPLVSVSDVEAREVDGAIVFRVMLDRAPTGTVTVKYRTEDGTAAAGDDYESASGTLVFAPGETEQTVTVVLVDDTLEDSGETFTLTLSDLVGAEAGNLTATGTIMNVELTVSEGETDFSVDTTTQGRVEAADGSVTGAIDYGGDRDWFAVTLEAGGATALTWRARRRMQGRCLTRICAGIHNADGELIGRTADNNRGEGQNARVTFTATEDGIYYVSAGAYGSRQGTYTLKVTDLSARDVLTEDTGTAGTVAVGGTATGAIDYGGDRDWFAVTLEAGRSYRFDLEGLPTDAGTLSDPYLRGIHNADGELIGRTADNNRGEGRNARVTFTATEDGTYYVSAGAWSDRDGTYTLKVTDLTASDVLTADTGTAGTVAVGGTATGAIDYGGDRDWFAVTLEAGQRYRFDLEGAQTDAGTLSDPYLRGIHNADGELIGRTTDNNRGEGRNARVNFTATEDGTYYVSAGAWSNREGTYTLTVEEVL